MAARKNKGTKLHPWPENVREKIKTSMLANRLSQHALAKEPILDATQVKAIEVLLRKTMPDLQSMETRLTIETRPTAELSHEQLLEIAADEIKAIEDKTKKQNEK